MSTPAPVTGDDAVRALTDLARYCVTFPTPDGSALVLRTALDAIDAVLDGTATVVDAGYDTPAGWSTAGLATDPATTALAAAWVPQVSVAWGPDRPAFGGSTQVLRPPTP